METNEENNKNCEIFFYKGKEDILESKKKQNGSLSEQGDLKIIKDSFLKVLDNKNLSFLLGSGCSSFEKEGASPEEIGIPVMKRMSEEFYNLLDSEKKNRLKKELNLDVDKEVFKTNLEAFLSTLHSLSYYYSTVASDEVNKLVSENIRKKIFSELTDFEKIESIIRKARNFLLKKCLNENNSNEKKDDELVKLYKLFYRKLLTRNSTLPRLNIFTTNYDLYSERAMDSLGIHYVNGFTGGISKFFNPAIFNYALAEKMDLSQSKWNVIDNFFYLYKIHGSVNWVEAKGENKLFNIREIQDPTFDKLQKEDTIMIYPTPLKYNASLSSPYSDLFREFQKKLMQNNNILVTIGYSFSDEHINNLIYQAFTIPSFRLIVIGEPTTENKIGELKGLDDSRIWIIGEKLDAETDKKDDIPLHYFKRFVENVLPELTGEDLDNKMQETINNLKNLLK